MPWSLSTQTRAFLKEENKVAQNEKWKKKLIWVFVFQKYGKFWSISLGYFIKHKPLISEEYTFLPSKRPGTQSGSGNRPLANVKIKEVLPHPDEPATVKKAQSEFLWLNRGWESEIDALWIIDWLIF